MSSQQMRYDVYNDCRHIFTGQNATVGKPKAIRKALQSNCKTIGSLLLKYKLDDIISVAYDLLAKRVFEQEARALIELPGLQVKHIEEQPLPSVDYEDEEVEGIEGQIDHESLRGTSVVDGMPSDVFSNMEEGVQQSE